MAPARLDRYRPGGQQPQPPRGFRVTQLGRLAVPESGHATVWRHAGCLDRGEEGGVVGLAERGRALGTAEAGSPLVEQARAGDVTQCQHGVASRQQRLKDGGWRGDGRWLRRSGGDSRRRHDRRRVVDIGCGDRRSGRGDRWRGHWRRDRRIGCRRLRCFWRNRNWRGGDRRSGRGERWRCHWRRDRQIGCRRLRYFWRNPNWRGGDCRSGRRERWRCHWRRHRRIGCRRLRYFWRNPNWRGGDCIAHGSSLNCRGRSHLRRRRNRRSLWLHDRWTRRISVLRGLDLVRGGTGEGCGAHRSGGGWRRWSNILGFGDVGWPLLAVRLHTLFTGIGSRPGRLAPRRDRCWVRGDGRRGRCRDHRRLISPRLGGSFGDSRRGQSSHGHAWRP